MKNDHNFVLNVKKSLFILKYISCEKINQSGVLLFSVGDLDLPCLSVPRRFQCIYHSSYIKPYLFSPYVFSRCFHPMHFSSIIPVKALCSSSSSSGAMPAGVGDQGPPTNSTAHLSDDLGWFSNVHPVRQAVQHLFSWSSSASLSIQFSCCYQMF